MATSSIVCQKYGIEQNEWLDLQNGQHLSDRLFYLAIRNFFDGAYEKCGKVMDLILLIRCDTDDVLISEMKQCQSDSHSQYRYTLMIVNTSHGKAFIIATANCQNISVYGNSASVACICKTLAAGLGLSNDNVTEGICPAPVADVNRDIHVAALVYRFLKAFIDGTEEMDRIIYPPNAITGIRRMLINRISKFLDGNLMDCDEALQSDNDTGTSAVADVQPADERQTCYDEEQDIYIATSSANTELINEKPKMVKWSEVDANYMRGPKLGLLTSEKISEKIAELKQRHIQITAKFWRTEHHLVLVGAGATWVKRSMNRLSAYDNLLPLIFACNFQSSSKCDSTLTIEFQSLAD